MTDAEFAGILDEVVVQTGTIRFRDTTNPAHPDFKPGMRESVVLIHRGRHRETATVPSSTPLVGYPSLATQAVNAIGAAFAFAASGCKFVDGDEKDRRLAACRSCEFFVVEDQRCQQCGCAVKAKVLGEVFKCPVGRW